MVIIICKHSNYHRTPSGKSWQTKPYETEWQEIKETIFFTNFQQPDTFMRALGGTEPLVCLIKLLTLRALQVPNKNKCNRR